MIRRLLFTVDYCQGAKHTGRPTDFHRGRDPSSERNLRKSASICGSVFLRSLRSFAAIPSCFYLSAFGGQPAGGIAPRIQKKDASAPDLRTEANQALP